MPLVSSEVTESQLRLAWAIAAPAATVWEGLVAPSTLDRWLGRLSAGSISPEGTFVVDHGEGYRCESTVAGYVRERELAYSWKFADEPLTQVAWTLRADGDATTLELAHRDLADLAESYRIGWMAHLTYLEALCLGSPLPERMFWPLHATLTRAAYP